MRRLNLNLRLSFAFALAALLFGATLSATAAQTTTTTLTPTQKAAAAAQAQAAAKAKAKAAATAQAQAAAAAKAKAAAGSQAAPATPAANARPSTMFTQGQPAPTNTAAATTVPSATAPAAAAKPTCGGFFNPCSPASNGGGTSSGGSSASSADSANRAQGSNSFVAGLGSFQWDRSSVNAYGCLRSGTRVFCDFDEFNQSPAQTGAGGIYSRITLVLTGGRIASCSKAVFVAADGSTFQTAQLDPSTPVRTMLEYDDIPETQSTVSLSFNNKMIQNISITPMNLQDNGNPAPRSAAGGGQQTAGAPAAGQAGAAAAPQSKSDQAQSAVTNVQNQKSKWGSVLSQAKTLGGH